MSTPTTNDMSPTTTVRAHVRRTPHGTTGVRPHMRRYPGTGESGGRLPFSVPGTGRGLSVGTVGSYIAFAIVLIGAAALIVVAAFLWIIWPERPQPETRDRDDEEDNPAVGAAHIPPADKSEAEPQETPRDRLENNDGDQ